jgi:phosphate transport system permease protein
MRLGEVLITRFIRVAGYSAIVFVVLIFVFLFGEGAPTLLEVPLGELLSPRWYPIEDSFGILPLLTGSLLVTVGAALIAVPLGVATAVFVAEVAPRWAREVLKPFIEVLAGLPSVMLGFLGIIILAPGLYAALNLPTGLTAFTGAVLLAWIALPTRSGVLIAVMLGIGRALGETMAVMMVTGNAPVLSFGVTALFRPVRTMTATIAAEMGEVASRSVHYHTLFFIGIVLFLISLAVNLSAASVVFRQRTRAERVLS